MSQKLLKCISIEDVPLSRFSPIVWLNKGIVVNFLRNRKNGYYIVTNNDDDYQVFENSEFDLYFKMLDEYRGDKIDQIIN